MELGIDTFSSYEGVVVEIGRSVRIVIEVD
jgi:hypothetical protein